MQPVTDNPIFLMQPVTQSYIFNATSDWQSYFFNATSDWQSLDKGLKKNQEIWTENHDLTEWSSLIVNETLDKIVTKGKVTENPQKWTS